jgi:glycerol-1-phosphate dehydrogenase [NAD(P)+]
MENMMHIDVEKFSKACSCGKPHEIFVKDMVVEAGALDKFPDYLAKVYDGNKEDIVLICDNKTD